MNNDLISREMAIDAIIDHIKEKFAQRDTPLNYISGLYKAEDIIEILPSAQPVDKDINVPTNDTISRQAAIDAIKRAIWDKYTAKDAIDAVCNIPSAQPERKKGQWLEHYSHEDGERDGVECSKCRTHYYFGGQLMNFCPYCGTQMRGEEDETNTKGV